MRRVLAKEHDRDAGGTEQFAAPHALDRGHEILYGTVARQIAGRAGIGAGENLILGLVDAKGNHAKRWNASGELTHALHHPVIADIHYGQIRDRRAQVRQRRLRRREQDLGDPLRFQGMCHALAEKTHHTHDQHARWPRVLHWCVVRPGVWHATLANERRCRACHPTVVTDRARACSSMSRSAAL